MAKPLTIEISSKHKEKICTEFNTSRQWVQMALDYKSDSNLAINIRKRAIELMKREINKPIIYKNEK